MANTFEELCQHIADKLAVISVANGYRTDIGQDVVLEALQTDEDDAPRTAVIVRRWSRRELALGQHERLVEAVVLVSIGANYANAQGIAGNAVEDVLQALPNPVDVQLHAGVRATYEASDGEILRRPEGMAVIAAAIVINAKITERTL